MEFLLSDGVVPFSTAILMMFIFGAIEAASVFAGFSLSAVLDNFLPDFDLPDADVDADGIGAPDGMLALILGWLSIGRIPALALLILFLCFFGLGGFAVQMTAQGVAGAMLPAGIASLPAFAIGLFGMSRVGAVIAHFIPKDQSQAVSRMELLGAIAVIVGGTATRGVPAQAKAHDLAGKTHFIQVEPRRPDISLVNGDTCIVVGQKAGTSIYFVEPESSLSLEQNSDE